MIEERGCELAYLPPYSPDFNPIEEAFSEGKTLLRKARAQELRGAGGGYRQGILSGERRR